MNRRDMIQRPLITILVLTTVLVLFSSASYAFPIPGLFKVPAIQVMANPQSVGIGQVSNINVNIVDISAWTLGGSIVDDEVDLTYSGPGNVVLGSAQGKLDSNNQFLTTFKADKAGEYTITARLGAIVEWPNGTADWVFANNSTKVTVTSGNLAIDPGIDLDAVIPGFASPSPSPSAGIRHDIDFNQSGFVGLADNGTSSPSPQPSNDTPGQVSSPGPSSRGPSPNAQDNPQSPSALSQSVSSPSPSATPQPGGSGDSGLMTTYLLIAVVVLIVAVGVLGGYILGKGKK